MLEECYRNGGEGTMLNAKELKEFLEKEYKVEYDGEDVNIWV